MNKAQLQTTFLNLEYHMQTMADYVTSFEEVLNIIEEMGSIIEEDMQIVLSLPSLSKEACDTVYARLMQEYEEEN